MNDRQDFADLVDIRDRRDMRSLLQYLANGFERDDSSEDVEVNYAADV